MPKRNHSKLKAKAGVKVYEKRPSKPFTEMKSFDPPILRAGADHSHIKSHSISFSSPSRSIPRYEGEMKTREENARAVAERRKQMVAPICNKGAYQYIGENPDTEIVKALGRKM